MSCDCTPTAPRSERERAALKTALALNAGMFVLGTAVAVWARSTGVLADALDMLCDASGYALGLWAMGRGAAMEARAARWIGRLLALMGVGVLLEALRRVFGGSSPLGPLMMGYAVLAFVVNVTVMVRLARVREGGVHLDAGYLCTRADVIANLAVFASGAVVWATGWRYADLLVAAGIAVFVFNEAREILERARVDETSS